MSKCPRLPPFAGPGAPVLHLKSRKRVGGGVMKGRRANLGRVLWSALQRGEVQSFILVFFSLLLSLPLALFHSSPPSLPSPLPLFSFVRPNLSNISLPSISLWKKRMKSALIHSFSQGYSILTPGGGEGRSAGVGFRRDQSNPVLRVGGSECFCWGLIRSAGLIKTHRCSQTPRTNTLAHHASPLCRRDH